MAAVQVTGFDIPHEFPTDYQPVFGMDVYHCVEYYKQRFGRWAGGRAGGREGGREGGRA